MVGETKGRNIHRRIYGHALSNLYWAMDWLGAAHIDTIIIFILAVWSASSAGLCSLLLSQITGLKKRFSVKVLQLPSLFSLQALGASPRRLVSVEAEKVETVDDDDEAVMELDEESVVIFSEKLGDEDKGTEVAVKEKVPSISSGVINLHKLALMMNKPIGLQSKFNEVINKHKSAEDEEEENEPISIQQSLSILSQMGRMNPTPTAKAVSSFNAYEYFWRTKPTTAASASVMSITKQPFPSLKNYNTTTMSKNYTTTMGKGCKEPMRSMIIWDWEPNCIATS
ncbi:hypothetical protein SAY87_025909 [Trapa incisa]|uniref:Uncharacterized protein n=1 Tax=Trapa incisa TaxID=236973 RepID=A0AAN7JJV5_9MYRT|nr:hypothetical protein SAY87_025909 [Trapa incisa]